MAMIAQERAEAQEWRSSARPLTTKGPSCARLLLILPSLLHLFRCP